MTFNRFSDEPMIGDIDEPSDIVECKQCGRELDRDPFADTDEVFCHDGCRGLYNGD